MRTFTAELMDQEFRFAADGGRPDGTENPTKPTVQIRRYSEIETEPIRWLWYGRVPRGKVTIIAGNPGLGKSQATASIAATVSRGGAWPDGGEAERGNVLILNAEDDAADTIGPRLIAAGADTERVYSLDAVTEGQFPDGRESQRPFDLRKDVVLLREAIKKIGGVALIIIDPITAYLGATDSHKNAEIRALLAPLSDLAAEAKAAVVCVSHLNKGGGADPLFRVMGSLAFVAAARAAWLVAKDPDDESLRLFLPLKNNIAKDGGSGLAFHVEGVNLQTGGGPIETSRIAWHDGAVHRTADEVMAASRGGDEERGALEDAKDFLNELLADDPVPAKQIKAAAKDAGISGRTIDRAKSSLGVKTSKDGYQGAWVWSLPATEPKDRHKDRQSQTLAAFEEVGGLCMDRAEEGQVSEVEL